ncbi:hypothetical protein [Streptomyces coelicoflavus]|uniref:hypothetical protein n=1 Tax=Streptomyces coelicoflavus TaxID=285562 RepID=UPI003F4A7516
MHKGSQLAVFLETLRWSPERLAREINRRYGENTVSLKAPYGWAKGAFPRGQVPGFVAAILSDHLGRTIGIGQIWPGRRPCTELDGFRDAALGPPWTEEHVGRLLRPLLERQDTPGGTPWPTEPVPGAVLVSLAVDWLTAGSRPMSARSSGAGLSTEMVDILASRIARLREVGDAEDDGLVMNWVVHELRWALRMAESTAYDAPTGGRLFGAIAELAQLAGRLTENQGHHARCQHYLLAALRASSLAGDRGQGARVLSSLSRHLSRCGNKQDAQRLVRLADVGTDEALPCPPDSPSVPHQAQAYARFADKSPAVPADQPGVHVCGVGPAGALGPRTPPRHEKPSRLPWAG